MQVRKLFYISTVAVIALATTACGGERKGESGRDEHDEHEARPTAAAVASGDTILVEMHSDGVGNYFKPNDIEAEPGDVVRFVLKSGVHNVHFLPDSNKIKTGLPPAS